MFGKWEVRELVYQINFPPFSARFDKRTIKEQKLIFGTFVHTELSISSDFGHYCNGYHRRKAVNETIVNTIVVVCP